MRSPSDLVWTQFVDSSDWVVYNPHSADIHLVTDAMRRLWTIAESLTAVSPDALASQLAADLGRPLDDELTSVTREALVFMERAGLLKRTS